MSSTQHLKNNDGGITLASCKKASNHPPPAKFTAAMKRGFSLVELSIVLVILGLLVGGVLTGRSLIRAAELRSATNDFAKYTAAIQSFRDKYLALPGDMNNAVRFWGRHTATTNDTSISWNVSESVAWEAAAPQTGTNNGDGDGIYVLYPQSEQYLAWQHLTNAGLIEGQYKGARAAGSGSAVILMGIHTPPSKMPGGSANVWGGIKSGIGVFISTASYPSYYAPLTDSDLNYNSVTTATGRHIIIGGINGGNWTGGGIYAEDAWNVDTKLDDGLPSSGKIVSTTGGTPACSTSTVSAGRYNVTNTTMANCTLLMRNAF